MAEHDTGRRQQPRRSARNAPAAAHEAPEQPAPKRRKLVAEKPEVAPVATVATPGAAEGCPVEPSTTTEALQESPPAAAAPASPPVNAYEAARAAQIKRNLERMAALQIPQLAQEVAALSAAAKKPRPVTKRARPAVRSEAVPLRQSSRVRGVGPDGATAAGIAHEGRDGRVTLLGLWPPMHSAAAQPPKPPPGPVVFSSRVDEDGGATAADAAFLDMLKASCSSGGSGDAVGSSGSIGGSSSHANGSSGAGEGDAAAARGGRRGSSSRAGSSNKQQARAKAGKSGSSSGASADALGRLSLKDGDVAKMTKDGITCMEFHPQCSGLVIAACDKSGKVSLWDVDHTPVADDDDTDGVLSFAVHAQFVSALHWAGGSSSSSAKLYSSSYDGTIRILDPGAGAFLRAEVQGLGPEDELSAMDVRGDGDVAWLATPEGQMAVADFRAGKLVGSWIEAHNRKINTLHLEPGSGQLLASSCSDGTVSIWDVRKLGATSSSSLATSSTPTAAAKRPPVGCKPVHQVLHSKSSQAACWAPDGSGRLLSISFDDTLRVWGGSDFGEQLRIRHNNNTGRWVTPFRPVWGPNADCLIVGNMKRGVDIFDASNGRENAVLSNPELMTAIASRFAVKAGPQGTCAIAAGTSSGRCCIYR